MLLGPIACLLLAAPGPLVDHCLAQLSRDPAVEIEDAYKWLHQATRGGEHFAPSTAEARYWMDKEWAALGPSRKGEPATVSLDPQGRMLRVNLRPYRDSGAMPGPLLHAFLASAKRFRPETGDLEVAWRLLGERLARSRGRLTSAAHARLDRVVRRRRWPAIDHSPRYIRTHRPAYRVVLADEWRQVRR